jgi:hypothetical protein
MSEPARHLEPGAQGGSAIAEALDQARIMRGGAGLASSGPSSVEPTGRRAAVFLGRPDDWDATTGRHLAAGT